MSACITLKHVGFRWPGAQHATLDIPQLVISRGEQVLLRGASGCGKSTLLSLIAGIHQPLTGSVEVLDHDLGQLSQRQRDQLRANEIGYIFQQFNLLPYLSALDNVALACQFSPARRQRLRQQGLTIQQASTELLQRLGLNAAQQQAKAEQLSVGQQQRVAAARALLGAPALIIADEPTSALDQAHRDAFIEVLFAQCAAQQSTLLFVTHDATLAKHFGRVIEFTQLNSSSGALTHA
jgi:putative ABC transport system ATP-binding protein